MRMSDSSNIPDSESQCPMCKKMPPPGERRRMWRFPLVVLKIGHIYQEEADFLYCRRCAALQNFWALLLATMVILLVLMYAVPWFAVTHWLVGAAGIGLLWLILNLYWRFRFGNTK
jgi:hypothetical protein